jgi:AraC-like DNA-binding protein
MMQAIGFIIETLNKHNQQMEQHTPISSVLEQMVIKALKSVTDNQRIILLLQCLQILGMEKDYVPSTNDTVQERNPPDKEAFDKIVEITLTSFQDRISLSQVAAVACMSISAFCHYFKQCTGKTYIDFLNEVRIGYACSQLLRTNKPVTEIGFESGYNTVVHFHRQFLKLKGTTPLQYRKTFSIEIKNDDTMARKGTRNEVLNPCSIFNSFN